MIYKLNPDQEFVVNKAVDWYYNSTDQVFQYDGPPGSGKSIVLNEIVRRLDIDPLTNIAPMSFIGAASLVMRTKGLVTARTAHSWCYDYQNRPKRDMNGNLIYDRQGNPKMFRSFIPKTKLDGDIKLIIIDEAYSMPRHMRPVIERFGIKILACGDQNQLPPVKDNPAYLIDGKIYHLTQVMRQGDRVDINEIANRARTGRGLLNGYYGNSMVINREDLTDSMFLWADAIICGRNKTRETINAYVRKLRGFPNSYLPNYGERVVCRSNNWDIADYDKYHNEINLVNGLIGTVINQPDISTYNKEDNTFIISFKPDLVPECVFTTSANYDYMISNNLVRNALKEDPFTKGDLFELAYAITCHIAQGSQFKRVLYIEENMPHSISSALNLVGATRATEQLIYVRNNYQEFPDIGKPMVVSSKEYNQRIAQVMQRQKSRQNR